jgi:hypothetical protein
MTYRPRCSYRVWEIRRCAIFRITLKRSLKSIFQRCSMETTGSSKPTSTRPIVQGLIPRCNLSSPVSRYQIFDAFSVDWSGSHRQKTQSISHSFSVFRHCRPSRPIPNFTPSQCFCCMCSVAMRRCGKVWAMWWHVCRCTEWERQVLLFNILVQDWVDSTRALPAVRISSSVVMSSRNRGTVNETILSAISGEGLHTGWIGACLTWIKSCTAQSIIMIQSTVHGIFSSNFSPTFIYKISDTKQGDLDGNCEIMLLV